MNGQNAKVGLDSGAGHEPSRGLRPGRLARLAWLPIPLLLAAIIVGRAVGLAESYTSETLTLLLSFTFYTLVSIGTLFLIGRGFLASGTPGLLLLECGVLLWSLAGTVGDAVSHGDANVNVTIFNTGIFLAGLCHLAGAILSQRPQRALRSPPLWLGTGCALALAALWLVSHAALSGWLPVFFVPGLGGTLVRYCVLISAIAMFVLSAGLLLANRQTRAPFTSWYALALLLLAVGLFGVMIQLSLGSVVNWLGRTAQWLGGLYLLLAAIATLRESDLPLFSPETKLLPERYSYGVAIAIVIAATAVRFALSPVLGTGYPYLIFFPAVILAALYGGLRAGLLATVFSALVVDYFFVESVGHFTIERPTDWIAMLLFLLSCTMISFVIEAMHKARARLVLHQDHLEELVKDRTAELEREMAERKQMEEQLQGSESMLRAVLDRMPSGVTVRDARTGALILSNPRGREIMGGLVDVPEEYVRYRGFHPDGREYRTGEWPISRSMATGEIVDAEEIRCERSDGARITLDFSSAPIRDSCGQIVMGMGVFHDVTTRKRAEEALRISERHERGRAEELATVLDAVPTPVIIVHNTDGTHMTGNRAADELFRQPRGTEISLSAPPEVRSGHFRPIKDERELKIDELPARRAARGENVQDFEYTLVFDDGIVRHLLAYGTPLRDDKGQPRGAVHTLVDITERKAMERELQKARDDLEQRVIERTEQLAASEKEFRLLAEAMPQIVWITRADGWNIYFNQRWVDYTGLTLEESYGHGWNKPFHPADRQRAWDAWQNAVTNNGTYSLECRLRKADGTYRWWLVRGVPVVNEKGETTKWFGTCTDIEEFKRVEDQLRQAQKMEALGTLSGGIAHDFNNILAAIIGFTELVADHVPKESREAHHLKRVMESSLRGRDLVRQMLIYSRKAEQEKKPLSLSSIVNETVKLIRATTPTTITIRPTVRESGPILADPTQMQQVIMNLCTNAAHAMREKGGTLDIQLNNHNVSPSNGNPDGLNPGLYTKLTVSDTGTGMSPDVLDRIFDPFFTTKKLGEGTGLGLSVVHGIVKQSNGHITVESKPGKGSTFTVYFPQTKGELEPDSVSDDEIPTGSERILFVDDEEALVEMGEDILAELGYEVTSRMNGKEALALFTLDPSRFDLIITDQTMPEMTGVELAKGILALRADMPIITCTGFSYTVNETSAKTAGIRAFAMKPLTKREIARTIRQVLDE